MTTTATPGPTIHETQDAWAPAPQGTRAGGPAALSGLRSVLGVLLLALAAMVLAAGPALLLSGGDAP